jgi:peptidoglycan/xylan/chitin deacetylase (PgdA/CDA1 family)
MRDSFTYSDYHALVSRLAGTHLLLRFADLQDGEPDAPFVVLRHDVDYSPAAALRLASLEAAAGWRATYFLLPNGPYYNLLDPAHAGLARRLVEMGHEVGLHYDVRLLHGLPREEWDGLLDVQARLVSALSGQPVVAIAMHQPALTGADPFGRRTDYLNAYHPRFVHDMTYVSDSCRAWRDAAWQMLSRGPLPRRLQLCLHPVNWDERDRDRETIFAQVHHDLARSIACAHTELMAKVADHSGVREHEARTQQFRETVHGAPR